MHKQGKKKTRHAERKWFSMVILQDHNSHSGTLFCTKWYNIMYPPTSFLIILAGVWLPVPSQSSFWFLSFPRLYMLNVRDGSSYFWTWILIIAPKNNTQPLTSIASTHKWYHWYIHSRGPNIFYSTVYASMIRMMIRFPIILCKVWKLLMLSQNLNLHLGTQEWCSNVNEIHL